jgi:hypothetical protein
VDGDVPRASDTDTSPHSGVASPRLQPSSMSTHESPRYAGQRDEHVAGVPTAPTTAPTAAAASAVGAAGAAASVAAARVSHTLPLLPLLPLSPQAQQLAPQPQLPPLPLHPHVLAQLESSRVLAASVQQQQPEQLSQQQPRPSVVDVGAAPSAAGVCVGVCEFVCVSVSVCVSEAGLWGLWG